MQLPGIVKQVGRTSGRERVYVEDYVYTYLQGLKKEAGPIPLRAALFGHAYQKNSCSFYMIYGAACVTRGLEQGKDEEQLRKEYFENFDLIGYVNVYTKGRDLPGKGDGYYIFYEKNEPMQNYLLSCYEAKNREQEKEKAQKKSRGKGSIAKNRIEENSGRKNNREKSNREKGSRGENSEEKSSEKKNSREKSSEEKSGGRKNSSGVKINRAENIGKSGGALVQEAAKKIFYGGGIIILAIAITAINDYNKMQGFVETAEKAVVFAETAR
ncbi:MAG: hypothetical protein NC400_12820 [Clostridium sp.]|nr:hypothetical protein [Clostridium sp.]